MADIILSQDGSSVTFPVLPPSYSVTTSQNNTTVVINAIGEMNLLGLPNLDAISFSSFFPASAQTYTSSSVSDAMDYVDQIVEMKEDGPCTLHLLDVVAMHCTIESFEYSEDDQTGDIKFSIELKKYIYINSAGITSSTVSSIGRSSTSVATPKTSSGSTTSTTYTVKEGDNIFTIARKELGTSDWSELYELNEDTIGTSPTELTAGMKLTLPS